MGNIFDRIFWTKPFVPIVVKKRADSCGHRMTRIKRIRKTFANIRAVRFFGGLFGKFYTFSGGLFAKFYIFCRGLFVLTLALDLWESVVV